MMTRGWERPKILLLMVFFLVVCSTHATQRKGGTHKKRRENKKLQRKQEALAKELYVMHSALTRKKHAFEKIQPEIKKIGTLITKLQTAFRQGDLDKLDLLKEMEEIKCFGLQKHAIRLLEQKKLSQLPKRDLDRIHNGLLSKMEELVQENENRANYIGEWGPKCDKETKAYYEIYGEAALTKKDENRATKRARKSYEYTFPKQPKQEESEKDRNIRKLAEASEELTAFVSTHKYVTIPCKDCNGRGLRIPNTYPVSIEDPGPEHWHLEKRGTKDACYKIFVPKGWIKDDYEHLNGETWPLIYWEFPETKTQSPKTDGDCNGNVAGDNPLGTMASESSEQKESEYESESRAKLVIFTEKKGIREPCPNDSCDKGRVLCKVLDVQGTRYIPKTSNPALFSANWTLEVHKTKERLNLGLCRKIKNHVVRAEAPESPIHCNGNPQSSYSTPPFPRSAATSEKGAKKESRPRGGSNGSNSEKPEQIGLAKFLEKLIEAYDVVKKGNGFRVKDVIAFWSTQPMHNDATKQMRVVVQSFAQPIFRELRHLGFKETVPQQFLAVCVNIYKTAEKLSGYPNTTPGEAKKLNATAFLCRAAVQVLSLESIKRDLHKMNPEAQKEAISSFRGHQDAMNLHYNALPFPSRKDEKDKVSAFEKILTKVAAQAKKIDELFKKRYHVPCGVKTKYGTECFAFRSKNSEASKCPCSGKHKREAGEL